MALDVVDQLVRSNAVDMVVVDSVAALVPRAELEGEMADMQMGLQARLMSKVRWVLEDVHTSQSIGGNRSVERPWLCYPELSPSSWISRGRSEESKILGRFPSPRLSRTGAAPVRVHEAYQSHNSSFPLLTFSEHVGQDVVADSALCRTANRDAGLQDWVAAVKPLLRCL